MTIGIRLATPDDHWSIESIENRADRPLVDLLGADEWPPAPSGASRAAEQGYLLVAEDASTDQVVGFAHVLEVEGIAHLEQVSVLPENGRLGYGRALIEAAKEEARRRGHPSLSLRTYAEVPWNAPFYGRLGFVETPPSTSFQRRLVGIEERMGLTRYGRRIQMTAAL